MSLKTNLLKAAGLGAVLAAVSVSGAFAATATATVNVRSGPGTGYGVVGQLYPGQYVRIVDQSGGWCDVTRGWVSCAYLTGGSYGGDYYVAPPPVTFDFGFGYPGFGFGGYPRYHNYQHDHNYQHRPHNNH
ncbi:MAG TPA: SH3 domain-containing protein [Devosia sp.]|jgi:uncharacterized protein YraI|nr:SH3 domain-containing protein [Devosia sp.]